MQERIAELAALTSQEGFAYWGAQGTVWQGWSLAAQGEHAAGIAQMLQGLTARRATGASPYRASHFALLAWAHGKAGQVEDGLRVVAEALARADSSGDRAYAAELYRLKGELLVQQLPTDPSQAECCFQQALAIARGQQARSWELRAAVSLSRLWQQQGGCLPPTGCSPKSTAGSPRVLTPPTSRKPRRCWRRSHQVAQVTELPVPSRVWPIDDVWQAAFGSAPLVLR
jgi:predicted ATPase